MNLVRCYDLLLEQVGYKSEMTAIEEINERYAEVWYRIKGKDIANVSEEDQIRLMQAVSDGEQAVLTL